MIVLQASSMVPYNSLKRILKTGHRGNRRLGTGRPDDEIYITPKDRPIVGARAARIGIFGETGTMVTFDDCLALCELTEQEIDAIAEHENLARTPALEMGSYLIEGPDGELRIQQIILDDIAAAQARGDLAHAAHLKQTLRQFIERHPGPRPAT
jgi:hypothetical protein